MWYFEISYCLSGKTIVQDKTVLKCRAKFYFDLTTSKISLLLLALVWMDDLDNATMCQKTCRHMDRVEYCHIEDYEMPQLSPTNPGNDYGYYKGSAQNHNYVITNVVDVLKGLGMFWYNSN